MTQDKYVTSSCIEKIQRNLDVETVPAFRQLKSDINDTSIGFPEFGVLGAALSYKYGAAQNDIKEFVDSAIDALEAWIEALEIIQRNWRGAEEASTVKYI
ncbi:hypothetical protein ACFV0L_36700 [Streptosporangium canum]|jgi:hypothetical protein|uniref:hypothetical protein n=1 Tax=Streptosporangium canum TaxID=324952 RepID=UPI00341DE64B